jgi:NAD(P)H-hydrate epimerase
MIPIATAAEMRELDRRAAEECGIPTLLLMENAGAEAVRELLLAFPLAEAQRILVVCGRGNNGGDGFVMARRLLGRGTAVRTVLAAPRGELGGDARANLEILDRLGAAPIELPDAGGLPALREDLGRADLVVDALLGTGMRGAAQGWMADVIEAVNRSDRPVVSVDIPSGLGADDPEPAGPSIRAALTVTFGCLKPSLVLPPASALAGRIRVADIGLPRTLWGGREPAMGLLTPSDVAPAFPRRDAMAHKGDFGHVLVVAGSTGKTGAAALAALGAQRVGAGLVTVAVPSGLHDILEVKLTEAMTVPLPETGSRTIAHEALDPLLRLAEGKRAVVIGPGLGVHPDTQRLIRDLVRRLRIPIVLDADGLNAFAGQAPALRRDEGDLVLTPHPGECARVLGLPVDRLLRDRVALIRKLAAGCRLTVVLTMARTLVGDATGGVAVVPTGNPGMATGGTGDVLAGAVGGLIATGVSAPAAARAGAYVHGLAGDIAAARLGQAAMLAGDLLDALPAAIRGLGGEGAAGGATDPGAPAGARRERNPFGQAAG